jgi:replicative DNA helicase
LNNVRKHPASRLIEEEALDYDVLIALSGREEYEKYSRFVKRTALSEEAFDIFSAMGEWLKSNESAERMDWSAFSAWFVLVRHAKMDKTKLAVRKDLIASLSGRTQDGDIQPLIEGLAKRDYAARIADVALRITDGDYSLDFQGIEALVDEYRRSVEGVSALERDVGAFTLDRLESVAGPGLDWRMPELMLAAGPVRQGDLIVFAKRPDAGGTTFLSDQTTYMAEQIPDDRTILWCNNEEQGDKVRRRIVQAGIGWTNEEMAHDLKGALEEYAATVGDLDKIVVFDRARMHTKDVERLCRTYNPALIIFDQLHKMKGFDGEAEHERQTLLFNWAREMAKEWAPVIAVHQLGNEAENTKYVGMGALYGAKTGPQGEADLIITMGRTIDGGNTRYFYTPKNKLLTPGDPSKRNFRWENTIITDRARFSSPLSNRKG